MPRMKQLLAQSARLCPSSAPFMVCAKWLIFQCSSGVRGWHGDTGGVHQAARQANFVHSVARGYNGGRVAASSCLFMQNAISDPSNVLHAWILFTLWKSSSILAKGFLNSDGLCCSSTANILASCVKLLAVLHVSTAQWQRADLYEVLAPVKEADRRCPLVGLLH